MSRERRIGSRIRYLVLAPGLLLAPFVLSTSVILVLMVSSGLVAGITVSLTHPRDDDEVVRPRRLYYSAALGAAAATSLTVVSLIALTTISATMAILLVPVLMFCSPTIRGWLQARLPRTSHTDASTQSEPTIPLQAQPTITKHASIDPQQVKSMSDSELCLTWRTSYVRLLQARSPLERNRVVAYRHTCLDEFESRHPEALAAWLDSGARAASGPDRFLPPGPDRAA